jgi:hypothetical protein
MNGFKKELLFNHHPPTGERKLHFDADQNNPVYKCRAVIYKKTGRE